MSGARFTVAEVVAATGGRLAAGRPDAVVTGVSIDSRTCLPGQVFIAIRGHRQDGHAFAGAALARGAAALVLARWPEGLGSPREAAVVLVEDTTRALQRLAACHRARHILPVVAVTGSNGKTTTKELTALVLGRRFRVLKAAGSLNNQWGVPLTLLALAPDHQVAVLELGMNAPREIAALAALARPTVGVVTTIAPAHLEGLGSLEGVQQAKGELVEAVPPGGCVVLNADDPRVLALARRAPGRRVCTFGQAAHADVRLGAVTAAAGGLRFSVAAGRETAEVALPLAGAHNAWNAAAALAVGHLLGVELADGAAALREARPIPGRLVWHEVAGVRLLDDTYNANPVSLRAALDVLGAVPGGRAWVVLGDMRELGALSEGAHREAGAWIAALPAAGLVTVGPLARLAGQAARAAGCPEVLSCESPEEAAAILAPRLRPGDRVLIKGSRSLALERALALLCGALDPAGAARC